MSAHASDRGRRVGNAAMAAGALTASAQPGWPPILVGLAVGIAIVAIAYAATATAIVEQWADNTRYRYAFAVLPTFAYLIWHHRRRLAVASPTASVFGVFAAAASGLMWLAADLTNVAEGQHVALLAALLSLVLAAVGWPAFRRLAPDLSLLVFLVPTGGFLIGPLQMLTVWMLGLGGTLTGQPVVTDGYTVHVGDMRYVVAPECAGLNYVLLGSFLGLTIGLLQCRRFSKAAVMALVGAGVATVANGVRVSSIVVFDHIRGTQMELSGHTPFHWLALAAIPIVLVVIAGAVHGDQPERHSDGRSRASARDGGRSIIAVIAAALVAAAFPTIAGTRMDAAPPAAAHASLPQTVAGWTRLSGSPAWTPKARLASASARAIYGKSGRRLGVFLAAATAPASELTGSTVDLVGGRGWLVGSRRTVHACEQPDCDAIRDLQLILQKTEQVRHIYFVYALGHRLLASPIAFRLRRAWDELLGGPADAKLIAIATDTAGGLPADELAKVFRALVTAAPDPL